MCDDVNAATIGWELRTIDQQIEELLHSDISCSIALPRLPKRVALEDSKLLKGTRVSVLDEDWDVSFAPWDRACMMSNHPTNVPTLLRSRCMLSSLHTARSACGTKWPGADVDHASVGDKQVGNRSYIVRGACYALVPVSRLVL